MLADAAPNQQLAATLDLPLVFNLAPQHCDVVDGHAVLSPVKFIKTMGLNFDAFATNAHTHRDTVTRPPAEESIQSHIRTTLQVLAAVMDASGDDLQSAISGTGTNRSRCLITRRLKHWWLKPPMWSFSWRPTRLGLWGEQP